MTTLNTNKLEAASMAKNIVLNEAQIKAICEDIGHKLVKDLENEAKTPVFLGVMKGSLNFMMDLIACVNRSIYTDYIQLKSYEGTQTTGSIVIKKMFETDIKDRTVVIVEDVVDTGLSMQYLMDFLHKNYQPKRIILVALFDKVIARRANISIDYCGCLLKEDKFLLGYGLDYNEFERNVPYVYTATPEDIALFDELAKR